MTDESVTVFSPATVANVACGFDVLGFCVESPGDVVKATLTRNPGVRILKITGDGGALPIDPHKNAATAGVLKLLKDLQSSSGIDIELHKKMPLGSGLGSSAASSVGGVYAANLLLGKPLSRKELIPYAMEGERIACRTAHADNVAPALLGGFTAIRSYQPLDVLTIPTELDFTCLLIKPHIEVMTQEAREVLGKEITLCQHIQQTGNLSGLLVGLMANDKELVGRSLVDVIAAPKRQQWIPDYNEICEGLMTCGALGCSISGSGPSIFALFHDDESANIARLKMAHFPVDTYLTKLNRKGVSLIKEGPDEVL